MKEGIEKLPQAMQPLGEATGEAPEEEEEEVEKEEDESIGAIAKYFLNKTFGVRKIGKHQYIGNKHVIIKDDDIIKEDGDRFIGTAGLWGLITSKDPDKDMLDGIKWIKRTMIG